MGERTKDLLLALLAGSVAAVLLSACGGAPGGLPNNQGDSEEIIIADIFGATTSGETGTTDDTIITMCGQEYVAGTEPASCDGTDAATADEPATSDGTATQDGTTSSTDSTSAPGGTDSATDTSADGTTSDNTGYSTAGTDIDSTGTADGDALIVTDSTSSTDQTAKDEPIDISGLIDTSSVDVTVTVKNVSEKGGNTYVGIMCAMCGMEPCAGGPAAAQGNGSAIWTGGAPRDSCVVCAYQDMDFSDKTATDLSTVEPTMGDIIGCSGITDASTFLRVFEPAGTMLEDPLIDFREGVEAVTVILNISFEDLQKAGAPKDFRAGNTPVKVSITIDDPTLVNQQEGLTGAVMAFRAEDCPPNENTTNGPVAFNTFDPANGMERYEVELYPVEEEQVCLMVVFMQQEGDGQPSGDPAAGGMYGWDGSFGPGGPVFDPEQSIININPALSDVADTLSLTIGVRSFPNHSQLDAYRQKLFSLFVGWGICSENGNCVSEIIFELLSDDALPGIIAFDPGLIYFEEDSIRAEPAFVYTIGGETEVEPPDEIDAMPDAVDTQEDVYSSGPGAGDRGAMFCYGRAPTPRDDPFSQNSTADDLREGDAGVSYSMQDHIDRNLWETWRRGGSAWCNDEATRCRGEYIERDTTTYWGADAREDNSSSGDGASSTNDSGAASGDGGASGGCDSLVCINDSEGNRIYEGSEAYEDSEGTKVHAGIGDMDKEGKFNGISSNDDGEWTIEWPNGSMSTNQDQAGDGSGGGEGVDDGNENVEQPIDENGGATTFGGIWFETNVLWEIQYRMTMGKAILLHISVARPVEEGGGGVLINLAEIMGQCEFSNPGERNDCLVRNLIGMIDPCTGMPFEVMEMWTIDEVFNLLDRYTDPIEDQGDMMDSAGIDPVEGQMSDYFGNTPDQL